MSFVRETELPATFFIAIRLVVVAVVLFFFSMILVNKYNR